MNPGCLQDFSRMIISNESVDFNDPKELDDPQLFDNPQLFDDHQPFDDLQLFDDQLEVWTLMIEKSTVIPPSLMVLFTLGFRIVNLKKERNQLSLLWKVKFISFLVLHGSSTGDLVTQSISE